MRFYQISFYIFALFLFRWVEEDPKEILQSVYECMERTCEKLTQLNIDISNIKGIHSHEGFMLPPAAFKTFSFISKRRY